MARFKWHARSSSGHVSNILWKYLPTVALILWLMPNVVVWSNCTILHECWPTHVTVVVLWRTLLLLSLSACSYSLSHQESQTICACGIVQVWYTYILRQFYALLSSSDEWWLLILLGLLINAAFTAKAAYGMCLRNVNCSMNSRNQVCTMSPKNSCVPDVSETLIPIFLSLCRVAIRVQCSEQCTNAFFSLYKKFKRVLQFYIFSL